MSTLGDIAVLGGIALAGFFGYQYLTKNQPVQQQNPAGPVQTPQTIWSPTQWWIPSTAPDLVTQWQQNAAAANVGGITSTFSWDPAQDIAVLSQWANSVLGATGLRW